VYNFTISNSKRLLRNNFKDHFLLNLVYFEYLTNKDSYHTTEKKYKHKRKPTQYKQIQSAEVAELSRYRGCSIVNFDFNLEGISGAFAAEMQLISRGVPKSKDPGLNPSSSSE